MSEIEQALLRALIDLDDAVRTMSAGGPKASLPSLFGRIDELAGQLPPEADPELVHFLQRKSYEKARERLEGRRAERGSCGRK